MKELAMSLREDDDVDRWEDVETFDDRVPTGYLEIIKWLQEEREQGKRVTCSFLKQEGLYFYWCSKDLTEEDICEIEERGVHWLSPKYMRNAPLGTLQLHCIAPEGEYKGCCVYKGTIRP